MGCSICRGVDLSRKQPSHCDEIDKRKHPSMSSNENLSKKQQMTTSNSRVTQVTNTGALVAESINHGSDSYLLTSSGKSAALEATSPSSTLKVAEKDQRTISTCRLKKATQITDVYSITDEVLGTGISGAVCVARHKDTNRQYAIKRLSLSGVHPRKAAVLHNEVSIYLQLDHPNIAKLIEVYETDEAIHLVMELCTGGELYHRLSQRKKYTERDAAHVTQQMLSAINYCHKHHICHRDLKLENWVYADKSPDSPVKLIDFGFSRIFYPGIPMTAMHGTVYYVSPEVMDGCYKEKCDIWSIGVIVYMLLSGAPPFRGKYDHEILARVKRGVPHFSGTRWDGISEKAKSFINFLLQKDPDARPSAEEALAHPWLKDESPSASIDVGVLKSMREFALCNILKRAALNVVALSMTSQELLELENAFRALDRNKQGTILIQDLVNVLIERLHIESSEAQRIFMKINLTGTEEVHYTEFIASTLQARFVKDETLIQEAFRRFDIDHKNKISIENLRNVLGDSYNGTRVEDIISLCDTNKDGYIDFKEFKNALTSNEVALSTASTTTSEPQELTKSILSRQTKRDAALSTLQSMRRATCLGTQTKYKL